jgi:hypothetical protein
MLKREAVTARGPSGALETKIRVRDDQAHTIWFEDLERKHAVEGLNPSQHRALGQHLETLDDARARRDWPRVDAATDALKQWHADRTPSSSDTDDESTDDEEAKTPRRSRGNQPVVEHVGGDAASLYQQNTQARVRQLNAYHARYAG